jgi:hypothetical protein
MSDASMWLTIVLAAIISLLAVYFTVSPLLKEGRSTLVLDDDKFTELLGRKDATLQAIKDLEFDYQVGKMSQEDFQRLDQRLRRQAIAYLQQIEKIAPASATLDEQLEAIIAQFRQTSQPPLSSVAVPGNGESPVEAVSTAQATLFCTQCGKPVAAEHKFCAHCGTPIPRPDPAPVAHE